MLRNIKLFSGISAGIATILLTSNSYAAVWPGFYIGGQVGWGRVHVDSIDTSDLTDEVILVEGSAVLLDSTSSIHHRSGWAGRLYVGYQFDCHWAAEFGWSKWQDVRLSTTIDTVDPFIPGGVLTTTATGKVRTDAFDLVAKALWPVMANINLYGKLGVAYLRQHLDASITIFQNSTGFSVVASDDDHQNKWLPTFGLGVSYDISPNISTDIAWNRIQRVNKSSNVGSTDMVTWGLAYNFG